MPSDDKVEVIVANTKLMTTQKEVLNLIWEQTGVYFEPLKPKDYRAKLNEWRNGCETIYPPKHPNTPVSYTHLTLPTKA